MQVKAEGMVGTSDGPSTELWQAIVHPIKKKL